MSFHKWSGLESGFAHEHEQIKKITKILQRYSEEKNEIVHLLTNFYVGGEEIDATIILKNNVVVIDLKVEVEQLQEEKMVNGLVANLIEITLF